jgi:hypothetical protein
VAKRINPANAVVNACEQVAALYRVRCYRMQSRVFNVVGAGQKERPMFFGRWVDRFGEKHPGGMADLLMTPKTKWGPYAVALWVECKFGSGRLEPEQIAFRDDVTDAGAYYIEVHDSAEPLIALFDDWGVNR